MLELVLVTSAVGPQQWHSIVFFPLLGVHQQHRHHDPGEVHEDEGLQHQGEGSGRRHL